jgi:putative transposase
MPQNRKHIRLREYDYSWQNAYFITICTKDRKNFFCENMRAFIQEWVPETMLSPIGEMAMQLLLDIPAHFPHVILDEFTIMPNHIHCILVLDYSTHAGKQDVQAQKREGEQYLPQSNQFSKPVKGSISVIINQFKAAVTKWSKGNGCEYFGWQSRFHDHVIRDATSHEAIRFYIQNNARLWNEDELYLQPPEV